MQMCIMATECMETKAGEVFPAVRRCRLNGITASGGEIKGRPK